MQLRDGFRQLKQAMSEVEKRVVYAKQRTQTAEDHQPDYQFDYAQEKLAPATVKRGKSMLSVDQFM